MKLTMIKPILLLLLLTLLTACGGGGESSTASEEPNEEELDSGPVQIDLRNIAPVSEVAVQKVAGRTISASDVVEAGVLNGLGGFRNLSSNTQFTGNISAAVDVSDVDGIARVFITFDGRDSVTNLCQSSCGTEYSGIIVGLNPASLGLTSGQHNFEVWLEDLGNNVQRLDSVPIVWNPQVISGVVAEFSEQQTGAINVSWQPVSGALRYNLYFASEAGVNSQNYNNLDAGGARLALSQTSVTLTERETTDNHYFLVTGVDGSGESAFSEQLALIGGVVIVAPSVNPDEINVLEDASVSFDVLDNDEPNDNEYTLSIVSGPQQGNAQLTDEGILSYSPNANYFGSDQLVYQIENSQGVPAEATVLIDVLPVNDPPEAVEDMYTMNDPQADLIVSSPGIIANDIEIDGDDERALLQTEVIASVQFGSLSLESDGGFTYTPDESFTGYDEFSYLLTDSAGASSSAIVRIQASGVNGFAPVALADQYTVNEDELLQIDAAAGVLSNDFDQDDEIDQLVLSVASTPANGELTLRSDGSFDYQPNENFSGVDSFAYILTDSNENTAQANVDIEVIGQNDPPVSLPDVYALIQVGSFSVGANNGVLANDSDPENDEITVDLGSVTQPSSGTLEIAQDGSFTYTPSDNFSGTDSFTYSATDGELSSAVVTAQLQVPAVRFTTGNNLNAEIYTRSQVPADVVFSSSLFTASSGTVEVVEDVAVYVPDSDFIGLALITVSYSTQGVDVVDNFYIDVVSPNTEPELIIETTEFVIVENTTEVTQVSAVDADEDQLTYSLEGEDSLFFSVSEDGVIQFASAPNYEQPSDSGADNTYTIDVVVTDDGEPELSARTTLTVEVTNVNEAPSITSTAPTTAREGLLYRYQAEVLDEDDENNGSDLTWTLLGQPAGMSVSSQGEVTWQPPSNTNSVVQFTLTVADGGEDGAQAFSENVSINLISSDDPPVATGESITVAQGQSITFNWIDNDVDEEGDDISFNSFVTLPSSGTVIDNGNGTFTYTHDNSTGTSDSFSYNVIANSLVSNTASVDITIGAANGAPSITSASSFVINENSVNSFVAYTATATDPENDTITWSIASDPLNIFAIDSAGQLSVANNSLLDFETTPSYSIEIKAEDDAGAGDSLNITVTINDVDEAPKIIAGTTLSLSENYPTASSVGSVLTALDPEGDIYDITLIDSNGLFLGSPDTFTLTEAPIGTYTIFVNTPIDFEDLVTNASGFDEDSNSFTFTYTITIKAAQSNDPSLYTEQDVAIVINDVVENTELAVQTNFGNDGFLFFNPYTDINNNEYLIDAKIDRFNNVYALIRVKNSTNGDEFVVAKYQDGKLDPTFGHSGVKQIFTSFQNDRNVLKFANSTNITDIKPYKLTVHDNAGSPHDGKVYIVGGETIAGVESPFVLRLNADGHLDDTFDTDGKYEDATLTNVVGIDLLIHSNGDLYFASNTASAGSSTLYVQPLDADSGATLGSYGSYDFSAGYDTFAKSLMENSAGELVAIGYLFDSSTANDIFAARLSETPADIAVSVVANSVQYDVKDVSVDTPHSEDFVNGALQLDSSTAIIYGSTNYNSSGYQDSLITKINLDDLTLFGDSDTECSTNGNCFGSEDSNSDTKPDGVSIIRTSTTGDDEVISAAVNNNGDISFITKVFDAALYSLVANQVDSVGITTTASANMLAQELVEKVGGSTGGVTDAEVYGVVLHDVTDTNNDIHLISSKEVDNLEGPEIETWITQYDNTGSSDLNGDTVENDIAIVKDHDSSEVADFQLLLEPLNDAVINEHIFGFTQTNDGVPISGVSATRFDKNTGELDSDFNNGAGIIENQPDSINTKFYTLGGQVMLLDQTFVSAVVEDDEGTVNIVLTRTHFDGSAYSGADLPSGTLNIPKESSPEVVKLLYDNANDRLFVVGRDDEFSDVATVQAMVIGIDMTDWTILFDVNVDVMNNNKSNQVFDAELLSDGSIVLAGNADNGTVNNAFLLKLELDNDANPTDNIIGLEGTVGDLEINTAFDADIFDSDGAIILDMSAGTDHTTFTHLEIASDDSLVVTASDEAGPADHLFRYEPNGSLEYSVDTSFNDAYEAQYSETLALGNIRVHLAPLSSSGLTGEALVEDMQIFGSQLWIAGFAGFGEGGYAFVGKFDALTGAANDTFGQFSLPGYFVPQARKDCTGVSSSYTSLCNAFRSRRLMLPLVAEFMYLALTQE